MYEAPAGRIAWSAQSNAGTLVWDGFAVQADPGNGIPGGFGAFGAGNGGGIWMSVEGAAPVEVVTDATATDPSISQDGKLIAWAQDGPTGGTDIYYLDPTEQIPTPHLLAASTSGHDNMPAVSPDGTRSAFVAGDQPNQTLKVAHLDGTPSTNAKVLTNGVTGVAWQPIVKASAGTVVASGTVAVGQTLTATGTASSGTAPITDSYVWQRCPVSGPDPCAQVGTGLTYTIVDADRGSRLRVVKTSQNAARSDVATSAETITVPGSGTAASVAPAAPSAPRQGVQLTGDPGTWTGTGNTYGYQYQRCSTTSPASGADIPGATSITYTPTADDVGAYQRCATAGDQVCADIPGATSLDYTPTAADAGFYLRLAVTATNDGGTFTRTTSAIGPVKAADKPTPVTPEPTPVAPDPTPVAPVPTPVAPVTDAPKTDPGTEPLVSVSTVTRANPSANATAKRADIGCKVDGARIRRCETTLLAVVVASGSSSVAA